MASNCASTSAALSSLIVSASGSASISACTSAAVMTGALSGAPVCPLFSAAYFPQFSGRAPSAPQTVQLAFMHSAVQAVSQVHTSGSSVPPSAKAVVGSSVSTIQHMSRMLSSRFFMVIPHFLLAPLPSPMGSAWSRRELHRDISRCKGVLPCNTYWILFLCWQRDSRKRKLEVHRQRLEQLLHHPFGDRADIQPFHEPDRLFRFLLRDVVRPQTHGEKQPQLLFQRQLLVAGVGHVAAHDAG